MYPALVTAVRETSISHASPRRSLGRIAALLFGVSGLASLAAHSALTDPVPPDWLAVLALFEIAFGVVCLLVPWQRLSHRWLHVVPVVGTAGVALSVWGAPEPYSEVYSWLYLLIAVFIAVAFRRPLALTAQVGILSLACLAPIVYGPDTRTAVVQAVVSVVCLVVASAVVGGLRKRLEARQEILNTLVHRDPLTGVGNYRTLHERLAYEIARHNRHVRPFAVLVLDIDGFKAVNEQLGHLAGDRLLRNVGRALSETVRAEDTVSRQGGDEFSVLSPETDNEEAAILAQRLEAALATIDRNGGALTASIGWAVYPYDGDTPEALLARADLAQRRAKRQNRSERPDSTASGPAEGVTDDGRTDAGRVPGGDLGHRPHEPQRSNGAVHPGGLESTLAKPAKERRRWHASADAAESADSSIAVMARLLAYLFGTTATVELLSLFVFEFPPTEKFRIVAMSMAAYGVVIALYFSWDRLRTWVFDVTLACGSLLITASIYFSGQSPSAYTSFYLWVVMYAFYFFGRRRGVLQLALVGLMYGAVLGLSAQRFPPLTNWLVTIGTLVLAGGVVVLLRERIERLVSRLADVARTDALTGLLNRRAFTRHVETQLRNPVAPGHPFSVIVGDLDYLKEVNARLGQDAGDRALERIGGMLDDGTRDIDVVARIGGGEFGIALPDTDAHGAYVLAERLRNAVRESFTGEGVPITLSFGIASTPPQERTAESLIQAAERSVFAAKELGRDRSVVHTDDVASILTAAAGRRDTAGRVSLATVVTLAEALDVRDAGTAKHSHTVGRYAKMLAVELGLSEGSIQRMHLAGILHDLGKVGVQDSILQKPGSLTDDEMAEVKRHPEIGAEILKDANLGDLREWVELHHERPDGLGYPYGLGSDEIPLEAKVLAVADAYEAMTVDRPYRKAIGHAAARDELRRGAGTQFDGRVVEAFLRVLHRENGKTADPGPEGAPPAEDGLEGGPGPLEAPPPDPV